MKRSVQRCAALLLLALCLLPDTSARAKEYSFSAIEHNPYQRAMAEVMREAFSYLGHTLKVTYLPSSRALQSANAGRFDGEIARISKTSQKYPNLIALTETPIGHFEAVAISTQPDAFFPGFAALPTTTPVAVFRGIVWSDEPTRQLQRIHAKNYINMLDMLQNGRVTYGFGDKAIFQYYQQTHGRKFKILEPTILQYKLYPHVHKSLQNLIPELSRILREMQDRGEIDQIRDTTFQYLLQEMKHDG